MASFHYGDYSVADTVGNYTSNSTQKPVTVADTIKVKTKDFAELLKELQTVQAQATGDNGKKEIIYLPSMISIDKMDEAKKARIMEYIENLIKELKGPNVNKEEKAKAYAELEEKVSSMGIKYKDAVATIKEIESKYTMKFDDFFKNNSNFQNVLKDFFKFNPENLQEPDKSRYYQAKAACIEIEQANKELAAKAGCNTQYPSQSEEMANKPIVYNPILIQRPWSTLPIKIPSGGSPLFPEGKDIDPGFAIKSENDGKNIDPGFEAKPNYPYMVSPDIARAIPV